MSTRRDSWSMTHDEAFLRAIRAAPADDRPRLIYADWLEEQGEPERAELIRVQVELEPQRFEIDRPRVLELLVREHELLCSHAEAWLGREIVALRLERTPSHHPAVHGPFFRRGLPAVAAVSLDALLTHGEQLFAAHPTITELAVFDVQRRGAELARCRLPEQLATLEIADWLLEDDAAALLGSPYFRSRNTVRLWEGSDYAFGDLWYAGSVEWPETVRIEVVELGGFSTASLHSRWTDLDVLARIFADAERTLVPIRPFLSRFPLQPNQGEGLHPGQLPDGRQLLFAHGRDNAEPVVFAFFDQDGHLVDSRQQPDPGCGDYYEDYPAWLARAFGYRPSLIWMREFQTRWRLGIQLLPDTLVEDLVSQPVRPEAVNEVTSTGELWSWLYQGRYVVNWGNTPWVNRRSGEFTDYA